MALLLQLLIQLELSQYKEPLIIFITMENWHYLIN